MASVPAPSGITITRSGAKFTAKWSKPNASKVTWQRIEWWVQARDGKWYCYFDKWFHDLRTSHSWTMNIDSWATPAHGFTNYWCVKQVWLGITNWGPGGYSTRVAKTYDIAAPEPPAAKIYIDGTTLKYEVKHDADKNNKWYRGCKTKFTKQVKGGATTNPSPSGSILTSSLNPDKPECYKLDTYAWGPGGKTAMVSKTFYVSKPGKPTSIDVKRLAVGSYKVTWAYSPATWYPVDGFEVQYADIDQNQSASQASWTTARGDISPSTRSVQTQTLNGVADGKVRIFRVVAMHTGISTESSAAQYRDWGVPEGVDEVRTEVIEGQEGRVHVSWDLPENFASQAKVLLYMDNSANVVSNGRMSEENVYIHDNKQHRFGVRICVDNGSGVLWSGPIVWSSAAVSEVLRVKNLTISSSDGGKSIDVNWDAMHEANCNGMTLAWSEYVDAFTSNKQPTTYDIEDNFLSKVSNLNHWKIREDIEPGRSYFFWARKWYKSESGTVYGDWAQASVAGTSAENALLASGLAQVGLSLSRSWMEEGAGSVQAGLTWVAAEDMDPTGGYISMYRSGNVHDDSTLVRSWSFGANVDSMPLDMSDIPEGAYDLRATLTNPAGSADSAFSTFNIITKPEVSLVAVTEGYGSFDEVEHGVTQEEEDAGAEPYTELVLTSLPLKFSATLDGTTKLTIRSAQSYSLAQPRGSARLLEMEAVWSNIIEDGNIEIADAQLLDGCIYTAQLVSTDDISGLTSDISEVTFRVDWERKAEAPSVNVVVDNQNRSATITPIFPDDAEDGDACDIYRVAIDSVELISGGATWGEPIIDPYTPFNWDECAYRVVTRTPYGAQTWTDIDAHVDCDSARIDWIEGSVELPYNLKLDDSRQHDAEVVAYLNGQKKASINPSITRKQTIASDVVLDLDDGKIPLLYRLSRYAGTCFVRTPNGHAYAAVADVSFNESYESRCVSVSIDVTETDANGDFRARTEMVDDGE